MDQLKPIIDGVKKHHFWIVCGVVTLLVIAMWYTTSSSLKAETESLTADRESQFSTLRTINDIREKSQVVSELEQDGKLRVVGAMYDIGTGKVRFLEH